jgi:hypothetical protein
MRTRAKSIQSLRLIEYLICLGAKNKRIEVNSTNFLNEFIGVLVLCKSSDKIATEHRICNQKGDELHMFSIIKSYWFESSRLEKKYFFYSVLLRRNHTTIHVCYNQLIKYVEGFNTKKLQLNYIQYMLSLS